jgi:Ca2+-binding RTX toxin-like protein
MRRILALLATAVTVAAGLVATATPAAASTTGVVTVSIFVPDDVLVFNAGNGAVNDIVVSFTAFGGQIFIRDLNNPVTTTIAEPFCEILDPNTVFCEGFDGIRVNLGDKNDRATANNVAVYGQGGDDVLFAGAEGAFLDGGNGDDTLTGGDDEDTLQGGYGDDELRGGPGDDYLDGGPNHDALFGQGGQDTLYGGLNTDFVDSRDGVAEQVFCGEGAFEGPDTARADTSDVLHGCENVTFS